LFSSFVSSAGVSSPYWDKDGEGNENPLILSPGETKEFQFILQNAGSDQDLTFTASVTLGGEIAKIVDPEDRYLVSSGKTDVSVKMRVHVPKDALPGREYKVRVDFLSTPVAEPGQFQFASGYGTSFTVKVTESLPKSEKKSTSRLSTPTILLLIALIIILIIIIILIKKRKGAKAK